MSRKRSITNKINLLLEFPPPDTDTLSQHTVSAADTGIQDSYFGENTKSDGPSAQAERSPILLESTSEDDEFYSIDWSKSSGSSTSGSDNLETEATQKVSSEFESIDRSLFDDESPKAVDAHELKQWKENFPYLRVTGHAINIPCFFECHPDDNYEEIIAEHSDASAEPFDEIPYRNIKDYIKQTVINNVVSELQRKRSSRSSTPAPCRQLQGPLDTVTGDCGAARRTAKNAPSTAGESFLQVSSMPVHTSPMPLPKFEYQSPLMRSHISASKWQRENSFSEYSSLPQIVNANVPCSSGGNEKKQRQSSAHKSRYSGKLRQKSGTLAPKQNPKSVTAASPRTKNITLPPIQNLNLFVGGDKSMSSTPRKFASRPVSHKLAQLSDNTSFYNNFK